MREADYQVYCAGADARFRAAMFRVSTTSPPVGQKFAPGVRVRIADDLGPCMAHFPRGVMATVRYTYAHAYGGKDVDSYCLDVDGEGETSWYEEGQLTEVKDGEPENSVCEPPLGPSKPAHGLLEELDEKVQEIMNRTFDEVWDKHGGRKEKRPCGV